MHTSLLLARQYDSGDAQLIAGAVVPIVLGVAALIFYIAAGWRVFTKAGQPGWAVIVPIYNTWVLLKIVGRPGWWLILYFIPVADIIVVLIVSLDLAKAFGKSTGFGVGLFFLPFIFYPILAWGSAQYGGPIGTPAVA